MWHAIYLEHLANDTQWHVRQYGTARQLSDAVRHTAEGKGLIVIIYMCILH